MNSIKNILKNLFTILGKFLNPGYLITIKVADVDYTVLSRMKGLIKDKDFIPVAEDKDGGMRNTVVSEYLKNKNHLIWISLYYSKLEYPERRVDLTITIENKYKGRKPVIKSEIDKLGNALFDEFSRWVSKDRLSIVRQATTPDSF